LTWRDGGQSATHLANGKPAVYLDGITYIASRLIWRMQTGRDPGQLEIDHRNHDCTDNRWSNLRCGTRSRNQANRRRKVGKKLPKGVFFNRWGTRYEARCQRRHLGTFDTVEEAKAAYEAAATGTWGQWAFVTDGYRPTDAEPADAESSGEVPEHSGLGSLQADGPLTNPPKPMTLSLEQRLDLIDARLQDLARRLEQAQETTGREWLPCGAMARRLGVTGRALQSWAANGRIPSDCVRTIHRGERAERLFHAERTAAAADKAGLHGRG
jgi:DNA-binding transcriptional MerR regulator